MIVNGISQLCCCLPPFFGEDLLSDLFTSSKNKWKRAFISTAAMKWSTLSFTRLSLSLSLSLVLSSRSHSPNNIGWEKLNQSVKASERKGRKIKAVSGESQSATPTPARPGHEKQTSPEDTIEFTCNVTRCPLEYDLSGSILMTSISIHSTERSIGGINGQSRKCSLFVV